MNQNNQGTTNPTPEEELKTALENAVYQAAVKYFEQGENRQILRGNGHHMAQDLVKYAGEIFDTHLTQAWHRKS